LQPFPALSIGTEKIEIRNGVAAMKARHSGARSQTASPESKNTGLWNMDSGLAAPLGARLRAPVGWRISDAPGRPGTTALGGASFSRLGRGERPAYKCRRL